MAGQIPRPANVEVTNTGTVYHVQEDGTKVWSIAVRLFHRNTPQVIAGSRRPDGTYRKPVRVRAGYTPLEENLYKGPEVQQRAQARGIPGLGPVETQRPSRIRDWKASGVDRIKRLHAGVDAFPVWHLKRSQRQRQRRLQRPKQRERSPKQRQPPKQTPKQRLRQPSPCGTQLQFMTTN
eukprot:g23159.t1